VSLACPPPSRRPADGRRRSQVAESPADHESGSSPELRTVRVTLAPADPRSTLAGVTAREAGAAGAPVVRVVELGGLVEVDVAAVVGGALVATEVGAPATIGPPWPSVGLETAGLRSHPSPTPVAAASSNAATSATRAPRRRGLWKPAAPEPAAPLRSPSGGPGTGGPG
jgi:hypothetical protein